jgi:hypothetical protein
VETQAEIALTSRALRHRAGWRGSTRAMSSSLTRPLKSAARRCLTGGVFLVFMAMFAVMDCILFLPALLQRRQQKSLKEIVTEDREFLEKRARLSRSISRASTKANIMARSQTELVD